MRKQIRLGLFVCIFAFSSLIVAQPNMPGRIEDCKQMTACTVNNNASFSGGLQGARAEIDFIKCSSNLNTGTAVEVCLINNPSANCPNHDCDFSCEPTGIGWSVTDCNDNVFIGIIDCNGCPAGGCNDPEGAAVCQEFGGYFINCRCQSPIVVDIEGNGFNLTDGAGGVEFDLAGDGTKYQIAWTAANSDDAWLALDRNGNGTIDSLKELFGNVTDQPESVPIDEQNGFLALAVFDKLEKGGNNDGVIDNQDSVFNQLRFWQDMNHNGISEAAELRTLPGLDITSIELNFKESKRTDESGNSFRYRAKIWDMQKARAGRWAWDVFLVKPR